MTGNLETLMATFLFATIFLFTSHWDIMRKQQTGYRRIVSFASGISVAYVFVHLLPELSEASEKFVHHTAHLTLPFSEYSVYILALLGFMLFYGMEYLVNWSRKPGAQRLAAGTEAKPVSLIQIGGIALYVSLINYLLVRSIEGEPVSVGLFAVAMACHFLSLRHSIRHEHAPLYDKWGKDVLAFCCLAGWTSAILIDLPITLVIVLLGFISGTVIMSAILTELPREKEGRFIPFILGGLSYTGILAVMKY